MPASTAGPRRPRSPPRCGPPSSRRPPRSRPAPRPARSSTEAWEKRSAPSAPVRAEFGLLAAAASRYGKRVAFLGADYDDSAGDAEAFLRAHHVPYPSYSVTNGQLDRWLPGGVAATPTTFYLGPQGEVRYRHTGQYATQGSLDGDVQTYALGG